MYMRHGCGRIYAEPLSRRDHKTEDTTTPGIPYNSSNNTRQGHLPYPRNTGPKLRNSSRKPVKFDSTVLFIHVMISEGRCVYVFVIVLPIPIALLT